ncbi:hypothetical protein [Variovorax sp. Root434]|uniref:hypothetical protein n=1 Tax=Variovorax sp. Root434 TaxID=1736536 RepID=UPI001F430970|nr:hypothetical protein [Variovorax sp. Root434]
MRESIEEEIPEAFAKAPADNPAAIRNALTCAPMRAADRLRTTDAGCLDRVRVIDAGSFGERPVGNGDGSRTFRMNRDP